MKRSILALVGLYSAVAAAIVLLAVVFGLRASEAAKPHVGTALAPGTIAYIPCGASINAYTASTGNGGNGAYGNGAGVVFQLAGEPGAPCTYAGQTFHTQSNETIQGDCSSPLGANTILDGGQGSPSGGNSSVTVGYAPAYGGDGSTGVTIQCLTIQNYQGTKTCPANENLSAEGCGFPAGCTPGTSCTENWGAEMGTWDGWLVQNCTVRLSGGNGLGVDGSVTVRNCLFTLNGHSGITITAGFPTSNAGPINIIGNEISYNNQRLDNPFGDVGQKTTSDGGAYSGTSPQQINLLYNYVHDNASPGLWCDVNCPYGSLTVTGAVSWKVAGNTIVNNAGDGVRCEISYDCIIEHNVIDGSNSSNSCWSSPSVSPAGCGYASYDIAIANSANSTIAFNNIYAEATNGGGMRLDWTSGPTPADDVFKNNVVTFKQSGGVGDWNLFGANGNLTNTSDFNTFFAGSAMDTHWQWLPGGSGPTCSYSTFATYESCSGEDAHSLIYPGLGSAAVAAGCRHVGCNGDPLPQQSLVGSSPVGSITDVSGNQWTVVGGQIYRNGTVDPATGSVVLFLYYDFQVFQENSGGSWHQLATSSWPAGGGWASIAGDPRVYL